MTNTKSPFYLGTIENLIIENRCPVCVYGEENKNMYLKWFDIENYNSLPTILVIANNGLCREHGWQISLFGNKLSVLNQFVTNDKLTELEKLKNIIESGRKNELLYRIWPLSVIFAKLKRNKLISILNNNYSIQKCPIYKAVEEGEQMALILMANFLRTQNGQEIYRYSPSLCWQHLISLLREISLELKISLTDIHIEYLKKMNGDFEEYFRKTDYRFTNEPKGEEQLAWLKSLRFYVGEKFKTDKR